MVLGMRQSYDLLLGDDASLLCVSVSLLSLVISDHFCDGPGVLIIDMRFNSLTFCYCSLSFNIHFSLKMWELFPDALTWLEQ